MTTRLSAFRGVWSSVGGNAPAGFAIDALNVRLGDGWIRPRYGFRNLAGRPEGLVSVHGLNRLTGYGDDYQNRTEWVTVENRGGSIKPYSVDPTTWARSEITNGGTALSLNGGLWRGFSFDGFSYWINPGNAPSLYKHEVGNGQSWTSLQNADYVEPVADPALVVSVLPPGSRPFVPETDAAPDVISSPNGADLIKEIGWSVNASGAIEITGKADNQPGVVGRRTIQVLFAAPSNLSGSDYIAIRATAGKILKVFQTGTKLELQIGGAWVLLTDVKETIAPDRDSAVIVARIKGVAGVNAVTGLRLTVRANPEDNASGLGFTILPLVLGGTYLGADAPTDRAWDSVYLKPDITYGVRYRNLGNNTSTGIKSATLAGIRFGKNVVGPSGPVGDVLQISAEVNLQPPYVDDPNGTTYVMDLLRLDPDAKWRLLGTKPNTTAQLIEDEKEEHELSALPLVTGDDFETPDPPPVFSSSGFVAGVPFKGWVVWLRQGGKANVQHSRVGNAEALSSPGDDTGDLEQGADFTLADNFADEPMGGVQAGDALLVLGREGVYGQTGNYPSDMTPFRKIPGSMGCAGYLSYARYRDENGNPGVTWLDVPGENVWFAAAGLVYATDSQARPSELSLPIRGTVRRFLFEDQREAYPELSLADVRMDVDEATGSLWLVLGRRALVLRPPSALDGRRHWEPMEFALGAGEPGSGGGGGGTGEPITVISQPFGPTTGTSEARAGQTLGDWQNPNAILLGGDAATSGFYESDDKSRWLRANSFGPWTFFPAEATLTGLKLRVRHRRTSTGPNPYPVRLAAWEAILSGATLATGAGSYLVDAFENYDIALPIDGITIDDVNAGQLSARFGYDSDFVSGGGEASNPSNWTVVGAMQSSGEFFERTNIDKTHVFTVTATWNRQDIPPPVSVAITVVAGAQGSGRGAYLGDNPLPTFAPTYYTGTVTIDTGVDVVTSGAIASPPDQSGPSASPGRQAEGTKTFVVPVSGGVGTLDVTMRVVVNLTQRDPRYPQDALARFYTRDVYVSSLPVDPTTVEVESVAIIATYQIPGVGGDEPGSRSAAFLAFGPDRQLVWLRSSGHLDSLEWCPSCAHYVEGTNRDGGLPMPEGYWESARLPGGPRRLSRVEMERADGQPVRLVAFTDRVPTGEASAVPERQRWGRFTPRVQGTTFRLRVRVTEVLGGVSSFDMVFDPLQGPGR